MICHSDHARDIIESAHWNWAGEVTNIEGLEGTTHGKKDLINNLCIACAVQRRPLHDVSHRFWLEGR